MKKEWLVKTTVAKQCSQAHAKQSTSKPKVCERSAASDMRNKVLANAKYATKTKAQTTKQAITQH
jgi:hypothetical protein